MVVERRIKIILNRKFIDYKIDSMKYIVRIIGILMMGVLLFLTYIFIKESSDWDWEMYIVFICLVVGWLYSIGTKFGFHDQKKEINNFYKVTCVCLLVLSFGGVGNLIVQSYKKDQENEKERVKDSIESAKLMEVIDWGNDTAVFNIKCQLKTRFKKKWSTEGNMEYIFTSHFLKGKINVEKYIVNLRDKNNFKIKSFEITSRTDLWDGRKKQIGGAKAEGEINLSIKDYKAIKYYDVSILKNPL